MGEKTDDKTEPAGEGAGESTETPGADETPDAPEGDAADEGTGEAAADGESTGDGEQLPLEAGDGEPGETEPEPEEDPKVKAGKASGKSRAAAAQRRKDLADNSDVQGMLKKAREAGAADAKKAAEAEAERAKMTEVDRAKAEASEAKAEVSKLREEADAANLDRDFATAVMSSETKIIPKARDQVRTLVAEAMDVDGNLQVEDALELVLSEHTYMVDSGEPSAPVAKPRAKTAPATRKATQTPAEPEPKKPVDAMDMTAEQFKQHERALLAGQH